MALSKVNAVIIGAGAGGPIVAKELAAAGLSVVLLERGKWYTANDDRKDDLRNQRTSTLGYPFGPADEEGEPRVTVDLNGQERVVTSTMGGYNNNAMCVGGGTLSYGAMAWRFLPQDFKMKSTYGAVKGSSLEDWPITHEELAPYYEKAEWEIGVSGDEDNPFLPKRRRPLPMPPLPPTREHLILEKAARAKGWHPFSIPMLRNSVPYNGRQACMRCRWCVGFACEVDAKCGTQNTVLPIAIQTGHCELRIETVVTQINVDDRGRATGVDYIDAQGRRQTQPADCVVVACGAIESARLLLNSKSKAYPNGIGNRHDVVGRNLQGHTYTGAIGLFDIETYDDLGPGASIAISDFNHGTPGLAGGAVLCNEFIRLPVQFLNVREPRTPHWGLQHKQFMRQFYRRSINVQGPTQEMPLWDNRVQVDPKVKDKWGLPVARLSGDKHPHTIEISNAMAGRAEEWLKAAGAIRTWQRRSGRGLSAGQHQAGTCRMGNDPRTSVVDRNCRIHEAPNIFVGDTSPHVTNGGFNPVLTAMALAYRTADLMLQAWKGTQFK